MKNSAQTSDEKKVQVDIKHLYCTAFTGKRKFGEEKILRKILTKGENRIGIKRKENLKVT